MPGHRTDIVVYKQSGDWLIVTLSGELERDILSLKSFIDTVGSVKRSELRSKASILVTLSVSYTNSDMSAVEAARQNVLDRCRDYLFNATGGVTPNTGGTDGSYAYFIESRPT